MSCLKQIYQQFKIQEESVGISLQQFKQKFVFNSNSGPDAVYLDSSISSPSQILGMTSKQQNICLIMMTEMIFKAGQILKLPVSTTIVAANISQYYFTRKTFLDFDFRQIAMGSMFLACKSEQSLRKSYQIACVFDYVFKIYEGVKTIKELELNSLQYIFMKQKVIKTENQLLFELGFQIYKLFDIPHRYISGLLASFNKHKQCNKIAQYSWNFLNDIYRTKAVIFYPGQLIAAASVFMALHKLSIPLPEKPWWILMEAGIQQIKHIYILTNQMYEITNQNQVNINIVSQILQRLGKEKLKVSNVLPVPYYRKIRLENQGLLKKIMENKIVQSPSLSRKASSQKSESSRESKLQKQNRKKSKKKEKAKKKFKSQKCQYRSKSRSPSKSHNQKKGAFQNDNQTPKLIRYDIQPNITQTIETVRVEQKNQFNQGNELTSAFEFSQANQISEHKEVQSVKKSVKSMLSKFSQQIKKIQIKNQVANLNDSLMLGSWEKSGQIKFQNIKHNQQIKQQKETPEYQSSDSEDEDLVLAELIQIKKSNLQKKEQTH